MTFLGFRSTLINVPQHYPPKKVVQKSDMSIEKDEATALVALWNTLFPFTDTRPLTSSGKMADGVEEADEKAFLKVAESYKLTFQNLRSIIYFFEKKQQYYRPATRFSHLFKPKAETPYLLIVNALLNEWHMACSLGQWDCQGDPIEHQGPGRLERLRAEAEKQIAGEQQIQQRRASMLAVLDRFDSEAEEKRREQVAREIEQLTRFITNGPQCRP